MIRTISILCVFASFFLSSCNPESNNKSIDRLILRLKEDPQRINPIIHASPVSREVYQYVMLQLGEIDPVTFEMTPLLIKELPTPKPIGASENSNKWSYDFEILSDAVWSDGKPVTSFDFLFTIKTIFHKDVNVPGIRASFSNLSDIIINQNEPKKFRAIVKSPKIDDLIALCGVEVYPRHLYDPQKSLVNYSLEEISNTEIYDKLVLTDSNLKTFGAQFHNSKYSREVVQGAGPYNLVGWETDQFIRLIRKENYWGENYPGRIALNAYPKEIIFQIIQDDIIAINQLKGGELDMAVLPSITGERFEELRQDAILKDGFDFYTPQLLRYLYLPLNNQNPLLKDKRVRRALAHLMDVDRLIEAIEGGNAKRMVSLVSPVRSYYNPNLLPLSYDSKKAQDLLTSAGWDDTNANGTLDKLIDGERRELKLRFFSSGSALSDRVALALKEEAAKFKVEIDIITQSFRITRSQNLATGDYEITAMASTAPEVKDVFYQSWHSSNIGGTGQNISRFANDEADALLQKIELENDIDQKKNLYLRLQEIVYEEQPVIFLYIPVEKIVVSRKFKPFITSRRPGYLANAFLPIQ